MKLRFTKSSLQALDAPESGKRLTAYDTEIPKLAIRITAAGSRTFYVVKRTGGQMSWVKLGTFPEMTVEQARKEAQKILAEFATGANPAAARRALRQELSFAEAFERFLAEKKNRSGRSLAESTKQGYRVVFRDYLASISGKKLSNITRAEVKAIHSKTSKESATQADRALAVVSSVFGFAADHELFEGVSPANRIQKNLTRSRDRFVQAAEMPYLLQSIDDSSLKDFFLLALLTGVRRANLQEMAWREIDMDDRTWHVSMTKNGTSQNVVLPPEAIDILRTRQSSANTSAFVFPGSGSTGHLVEPKKAWASILYRASLRRLLDHLEGQGVLSADERQQGERDALATPTSAYKRYKAIADELDVNPSFYDMTDLRIHDLRRTFGSWQAKMGSSMQIIGKSLNHKSIQATMIYSRLDLDPVRKSVDNAASAMYEAAGIKPKKRGRKS